MTPSKHLRSALAFLLIGISAALALSPGRAGTSTARRFSFDQRQAVNRGVEFERGRKWADAIQHYEESVKRWPDCSEIEYGLRRSKIHFGVDRRYSDATFRNTLLSEKNGSSKQLFDNVLDATRRQYLEPISLTSFLAHGTESLYQALDEPRFVETNVPENRRNRIEAVRTTLRRPNEYWNRRIADREEAHRFIEQVAALCRKELDIRPAAVTLEFVFGGCNSLDDYSGLLTPGRYTELNSNIHGQFVGLGVEVKADPGMGLKLLNVISGSPAAEGGLLPGEHIIKIGSRDVRNSTTDEAANWLTGKEGSEVTLQVVRGTEDHVRSLSLIRRPVVIHSIPVAKIVDRPSGVGYIQLVSFQDSTANELDKALNRLKRDGMQSLILDLRGNPGGLLTAAVEVADRFIEQGVLVEIRGRKQNEKYSAHRPGTWNLPVIVLIDGESASASEIVAGAFRDHRRGTIVGRQSYGKWSVQTIFPAAQQCGLRVTTAKFYSPHGHNLARIGLKPDIETPAPSIARNEYRAPGDIDFDNDEDIRQSLVLLRNEVARK